MNNVYSVNAVKKIKGHDGQGYSANLLKNGKKIAEVFDDGWGGELQVTWLDSQNKAQVTKMGYQDKPITYTGTAEEAEFEAYVMTLPKIPAQDGMPEMYTSSHIVIDELANNQLMLKQLSTYMKKNFTIKCSDGKILTWGINDKQPVDVIKKYVMKTHPDCQIINDLQIDQALKVFEENNLIG